METALRPICGDSLTDFVAWIDRSDRTSRAYITNIRQFLAWLRFSEISQPARQDVINYRQWLLSEHDAIILDNNQRGWKYRRRNGSKVQIQCRPSTVTAYLQAIRLFFRWTNANGLYPDITAGIHAPALQKSTHRRDALTPAEVLAVERSILASSETRIREAEQSSYDPAGQVSRRKEQSKRLYAMYLLAVNAGLRTVELSRAKVKDFEVRRGQAWLYIWGKGHTEADQVKPLAREVAEAVKDYLATREALPTPESPLFTPTGNRAKGKHIKPETISRILKTAIVEAGYDSARLTAHSLRHTAGTAVHEITGDLYATQQYMRHKNPATTEIYLHTDNQRQEIAIAQELYDHYHEADAQGELDYLTARLRPDQLAQLTQLARTMLK